MAELGLNSRDSDTQNCLTHTHTHPGQDKACCPRSSGAGDRLSFILPEPGGRGKEELERWEGSPLTKANWSGKAAWRGKYLSWVQRDLAMV